MPFLNENRARGLPANGSPQVGRTNQDDDATIEAGALIPWSSDPAGSYLYYDCVVTVVLDSGIVVHNTLPQVNNLPDTLASAFLDDPAIDQITDRGINLKSRDQFQDLVQRMGHSRYWFNLSGRAMRVGYPIPIPGIKKIGGVDAYPHDDNPQMAINAICPGGNYGGVPLWRAEWSLWYTTIVPPTTDAVPAVDLAGHVTGASPLPRGGIQAPFSQADDNAQAAQVGVGGFLGRGR